MKLIVTQGQLKLVQHEKDRGRRVRAEQLDADLAQQWRESNEGIGALHGVKVTTQGDGRNPKIKAADKKGRWQLAAGFHNPYTFVPTLPRPGFRPEPQPSDDGTPPEPTPPTFHDLTQQDPPQPADHLEDGPPAGHDRLLPDRYTGRITVQLTTVSPLVLLDTTRTEPPPADRPDTKHRTFPVRIGPDGRPLMTPTEVKGMLRAAYEAATNSRYGVFGPHQDRLGYRLGTADAQRMVPARVTDDGQHLELLPGTSEIGRDRHLGKPQGPMYAAWLPRYQGFEPAPGDNGCRHGQNVEATLRRFRRRRGPQVWEVRAVGSAKEDTARAGPGWPTDQTQEATGYVCITGHNAENKHHERLFFRTESTTYNNVPLDEPLTEGWKALIESYLDANDDATRRKAPTPHGAPQWSAHLRPDAYDRRELGPGTLCYALVTAVNRNDVTVGALYPVTIARAVYDASPADCLHPSLRPARSIDRLSPADRVFGWVRDGRPPADDPHGRRPAAYRGHVRPGKVTCRTDDAIETFDSPLQLAILSSPKPSQARFYAAKDPEGTPLDDRANRSTAYTAGTGLRGRKVYWHHGLDANHPLWQPAQHGSTGPAYDGRFAECRHPAADRTSRGDEDDTSDASGQSRSIEGWIKPGTVFEFALTVDNLSRVELGALLWLLDDYHRTHGACHRMAFAKPFGFGSVKLEIDYERTSLATGRAWAEAYRDLSVIPQPVGQATLQDCVTAAFKDAVKAGYGADSFEQVSFIAALIQAGNGPDDGFPIHYPRVRPSNGPPPGKPLPPDPAGKQYLWFVANEGRSQRALPPPDGGPLPILDER